MATTARAERERDRAPDASAPALSTDERAAPAGLVASTPAEAARAIAALPPAARDLAFAELHEQHGNSFAAEVAALLGPGPATTAGAPTHDDQPKAAAPRFAHPTTDAPADHAAAQARHQANIAAVKELVADTTARKADKTFDNSCRWIEGKDPTVLTQAHDSAERVAAKGRDPKERAYFSSDYDPDDKQADLEFLDGAAGVERHGELFLVEPASVALALRRQVFVHELQHRADEFGEEARDRDEAGTMASYRTEFGAWWIGRTFDDFSASPGTGGVDTYGVGGYKRITYDNARQRAIANHLAEAYELGGLMAMSAPFAALVEELTHPVGVNLVNSPEIDRLYQAVVHGSEADALAAAKALPKDDRAALKDPAMKESWQALLADKDEEWSAATMATLRKRLAVPKGSPAAKPVTSAPEAPAPKKDPCAGSRDPLCGLE